MTAKPTTRDPEDLVLHGLLVVIGAIPVTLALVHRAFFGVEPTLGVLMVLAGVLGVLGRGE